MGLYGSSHSAQPQLTLATRVSPEFTMRNRETLPHLTLPKFLAHRSMSNTMVVLSPYLLGWFVLQQEITDMVAMWMLGHSSLGNCSKVS